MGGATLRHVLRMIERCRDMVGIAGRDLVVHNHLHKVLPLLKKPTSTVGFFVS
jgi:DNA-binding phage protein